MSSNTRPCVTLHDKTFRLAIPFARIERAIEEVAVRINADYHEREVPVFLGMLNGAFMFMADLMKKIDFRCEVSFVKLASYSGLHSTGAVSELIGLNRPLRGRHVIVVEDIVDTGESIDHVVRALAVHEPATVAVATMLFKPTSYRKQIPIDYAAIEVPDDFIVGYGLDYDQLGRNLTDIYKIVDE